MALAATALYVTLVDFSCWILTLVKTIHNPGTSSDARLANPGPDVSVVVETSYQQFLTKNDQDWLKTSVYDRAHTAYMVHSVPVDKIRAVTLALRQRAEYLFITDLTENFYESFGKSWDNFVAAMHEPLPCMCSSTDGSTRK
jgi:hypothetical protein